MAEYHLNNFAAGESDFMTGGNIAPDAPACLWVGRAREAQGNTSGAIEAYEKVCHYNRICATPKSTWTRSSPAESFPSPNQKIRPSAFCAENFQQDCSELRPDCLGLRSNATLPPRYDTTGFDLFFTIPKSSMA